jgi:hypothetical protein
MGFFTWLEDMMVGQSGKICARRGCRRPMVDGGFCSKHRNECLDRSEIGLLELNNFRMRYGDPPLTKLDKKGKGGGGHAPESAGAGLPAGESDRSALLALLDAEMRALEAVKAEGKSGNGFQGAMRDLEAKFGLRPGTIGAVVAETEDFE